MTTEEDMKEIKLDVEKSTGVPTEVWEINRCRPEYIQTYSITNRGIDNQHGSTTIYFNRLKYSSEYGGDLMLYLNDLVIGRINMEDSRVVLGENVNLLELLNLSQQE